MKFLLGKNWLLAVITFLLCLLVGELTLRAIGFGFPAILQSNPHRFWNMAPNHRIFAPRLRISFDINSFGFRDDEIDLSKMENEIRILGLGDSNTFGLNVAFDKTYLQRLESMLNKYRHADSIQVINTGHPGYNLYQEWMLLEKEGLEFDPDLVLLGFNMNDILTEQDCMRVKLLF